MITAEEASNIPSNREIQREEIMKPIEEKIEEIALKNVEKFKRKLSNLIISRSNLNKKTVYVNCYFPGLYRSLSDPHEDTFIYKDPIEKVESKDSCLKLYTSYVPTIMKICCCCVYLISGYEDYYYTFDTTLNVFLKHIRPDLQNSGYEIKLVKTLKRGVGRYYEISW